MPEIRKDPITGRWVIISTERSKRPSHYDTDAATAAHEPEFCPFCPGHERATPDEVFAVRPNGSGPNGDQWELRVIPNKYPALKIEGALDRAADAIYDRMNGVGAHEVIIEVPQHDLHFGSFSDDQATRVLRSYRQRINDLAGDPRLAYSLVFKNHGARAGATLAHPHSQLIALPVVPETVRREMIGGERYHEFRDRCAWCDIVSHELRDGARLVYETANAIAICPYAPRFPFETWVLPRSHASHYGEADETVLRDTARTLREVIAKLRVALKDPPYNFMLHTAPHRSDPSRSFHWHIEVIPALTDVAGFEWGSGFFINPTPPERAAEFLREVTV